MKKAAYRMPSKACPCGAPGVFHPNVVCNSCWPKLPRDTRDKLTDAIKALRAASSAFPTYRAAADAAVAFIKSHNQPTKELQP